MQKKMVDCSDFVVSAAVAKSIPHTFEDVMFK